MTESEFARQVDDLARILGWEWAHFRPAQTARGWRTPVEGPLGKGWPDRTFVRGSRLVFAELKADKGTVTPDQARVLDVLSHVGETYLWHPADIERIAEVLR